MSYTNEQRTEFICDECEKKGKFGSNKNSYTYFRRMDKMMVLGWYWSTKEHNPPITRHFCPDCIKEKIYRDFYTWNGQS